jgi:hypothetical protein
MDPITLARKELKTLPNCFVEVALIDRLGPLYEAFIVTLRGDRIRRATAHTGAYAIRFLGANVPDHVAAELSSLADRFRGYRPPDPAIAEIAKRAAATAP